MGRLAKQLLPFFSLIFVIVLWSILDTSGNFLTFRNFQNVLMRSTPNMIIAAGMTYVIITAGIDLSVGSLLAFCGMIGSLTMLLISGGTWEQIAGGKPVELTAIAMMAGTMSSILAGGLCGLANGMLITRLKLAPFIVTLGAMSIFRGASYLMNHSKSYAVSDYEWLDMGEVTILSSFHIPSSVLLMIIVLLIAGFILKYTRFGRYTYAIGSNVQTAFHAGVNVKGVLVATYTMTGAPTGLAAMIITSRASGPQPTAGLMLELDIIAAVIIGGCSPSGGRGSILGTIVGTLLIQFLRNGLTMLKVEANVQLVVVGAIIILAVTADQIATKRES
ncbi:MAG: ABC transporter permease [Phycisphaerae bacterium]|nr:ABC transporter permease [Phycisphaerae bacterium]